MRLQRTLQQEVRCEGIGLHSGAHVVMRLKPAPRNSGIVIHRRDKGVWINADVSSVCDTAFCTTLGFSGVRVKTVEHIMAALAGLGIDNVVIDIDGPEIPVMDGSSAVFVERILSAGIAKQASKKSFIKILKPIIFKEGNIEICALPFNGSLISYQIYFSHHLLGLQKLSVAVNEESFIRDIAPARTFGFLKDVEIMRANGLAKGGSLDNAVILSDTEVLNEGGLRFSDECIRHKVLDLIGDLALIGYPIQGHLMAVRSGHASHVKFAKKLLASRDSWELVTERALDLQARHAVYS